MQRWLFPFEVKAGDTEEPYFEGYASVFGNVDRYGERVQRGAFKTSLKSRRGMVPLFWMHSEPIGMARCEEDEHGLKVTGYPFVKDVQRAREAYALMKGGAVHEMSFGFYVPPNGSKIAKDGVKDLLKVDLVEVTVGWNPVNPEARITGVKAGALASEADLRAALEAGTPMDSEQAARVAHAAWPVVGSPQASGEDAAKVVESLNALAAQLRAR